jgi:hypothetical protein
VKKTKQGVRDLNGLPGKSKGIRLEMPPEQHMPDEESPYGVSYKNCHIHKKGWVSDCKHCNPRFIE